MTITIRNMYRQASGAVVVAAIAMISLPGARGGAQTGCVREDFTAQAVNRAESAVLLPSTVDIHIGRWSAEVEKDRFARALLDRGTDALLEALRKAPVAGQIRTPNTFPYDVQFAWQEPLPDGGRRVLLITDRAIVVWNDVMRLQALDDLFTVIELRLSSDGEGEGKVAIGSNIHVNRSLDLIELRDYDSAPVRLIDVGPKRPTT